MIIILSTFGDLFVLLGIIGLCYKPFSVYKNHPEQKNPFEGKKVIFVENSEERGNADGLHGHLEAVGDTKPFKSGYAFWKRLFDIVLSFFALIILSPFCLRHSLDELPQIWDIFVGSMSVIGSAPCLMVAGLPYKRT